MVDTNRTRWLWLGTVLVRLIGRGPILFRIVFVISAISIVAIFIVGRSVAPERSFQLNFQTTILTLNFVGDVNIWQLPEATICRLRPVPDLRLPVEDGPGCASGVYEVSAETQLLMEFPVGMRADVRLEPSGSMRLLVSSGGNENFPDGTIVLVGASVLNEVGMLPFVAILEGGTSVSSGLRFFLISGRWQAREAGLANSFFRGITEVVKTGTLDRGSRFSVFDDGVPATVFGHISQGQELGQRFFEVVGLSEPGKTELRIDYYGTTEPVVIRPDWIDSAVSSPTLLALAAVFSLLASVSQVLAETKRAWSTGGRHEEG